MSIESGLRRVTDAVRERTPELYDVIRGRLQTEPLEYSMAGNEQLSAAESEAITASLRDVLDYIADGSTGSVRASNEALREVRLAARAGVSLQPFLQGSRVAQSVTWDFVLEEAYRLLEDTPERVAVLRRASANHFAWNEIVSGAIIEAFEQESSVYALQSRERRKMTTLNALLAGLQVDTAELEYAFDGPHLAAQVWGATPDPVARLIGARAGRRPLVGVTHQGDGYIWVPWSPRLGPPSERLAEVEWPDGARVAFGALREGVEGFRLSHRQAGEARAVAEALGLVEVWYDDVVLEALAMHDLPATRAFVLDELEPLGDVLDPDNVLIETLRTYFEVGENAVVTAQRLGVHSRTVAYRLRSVESKMGAEGMSRDELPTALRLVKLVTSIGEDELSAVTHPSLATPAL